MRQLLRRAWYLLRRRRFDEDLREELEFHRVAIERELEQRGTGSTEASFAARRAVGSVALTQDQARDVWMPRWLQGMGQDTRFALRSLRRTPLVTSVALLSLALGIGANTAIFSIINSLLLRSLPVKDPARLVLITDSSPVHVRVWGYPVWTQIHQRPDLFEHSAAWSLTPFNLASGGETQLIDGMWASGSFFETLGVTAVLGRTFSEVDDRAAGPDGPVAVISYGFWQRRFGAGADAIGRSLRIEGIPFTIVGVTPPDFAGPEIGRAFDVIVPLSTEPMIRGGDSFLNGTTFLTIVARLKPDQSPESATAGLRAVQSQIRDATLAETGMGGFASRAAIDGYLAAPFVLASGATGYSGAHDLREQYGRPLMTILVVVVLLLLIACVNVANLLVARKIARRHELSVRLALGASRWRLARPLLVESAVLCGMGAAFGLALAVWGSRLLVDQLSTPVNAVFLDLTLDGRVLAFTVAITVMTTLLFGTAPAFRGSRAAPMDALRQQGRTFAGHERGRLASWVMVAQVSLSLLLVVAAGLFVRTFAALSTRPLGFDPAQVLLVDVDARRTTNDAARRIELYERARETVRVLPNIAAAALSLTTPVGSGQFTPLVEIDGVSDTRGPVWSNLISPGWFATFRTSVMAGRDFTDQDRAGTPRVAVVNEAFVRKFAGDRNPIGWTLTLYPHTARALGPIEIVGVVEDAVYTSLRSPAPPTYYLPLAQFDYLSELGIRTINLSIRVKAGPPGLVIKNVVAALATASPQFALTFRPLVSQVNASLTQERLIAWLAGAFGTLALLLAGLGLYGVTSYAVSRRRTEIGIRMALGAGPRGVMRLVLSRVAVLVGLGVVAGTMMSLWVSRFVATLLYGLQPHDPTTLIGAVVVLATVAGVAAWIPAWRASRIDPAMVLRNE